MGKKFKDLMVATMSPESIARAKTLADEMRREMILAKVRRARLLTHQSAAPHKQVGVADLERGVDQYLASFRAHIEQMGGELEVAARFPSGDVEIRNFSTLGEAITEENAHSLKAST
jgi:hypothetical protein